MFMRRLLSTNLISTLPEFEISKGIGGALQITIPPGQKLIVKRECVLSMPSKIIPTAETDGGVLVALSRLTSGGPFLFDSLHNSDTVSKTVIVSPKAFGTTEILKTNGISEFYISKASFLACTTSLTLSSKAKGLGMGLNGYFNYLVKGKGIIALSSESGLQTFELEPSSTVLVNPRMLLAWESCLNPLPVKKETYIPPKLLVESKGDAAVLAYIKRFGLLVFSIVRNSIIFATNSILGTPVEYYSMKGPGKYIMATQKSNRVMSHFL